MKFKVITFGCKVNAYESEVIKEKFLASNYILDDNADIIVINTCSVTNVADQKCKKAIRRLRREHPQAILIVCGCCSQNHQELLNDLDIDILIGNKDKSKIVEIAENYMKHHQKVIKFYDNENLEFEDMVVNKFTSQTRAFVKIQDGCDNYCAFCIIPYLRGNLRSKDFDQAVKEVKTLVSNGHKEVVLTGIHTGSYGYEKDYDLVDLINEISKIDDLKRIRISSIEIMEINEKFLEMLKNNDKVCDHLHIPLQSGGNEILKLMNRRYDAKYYEEIISKIRKIRPDISITTDVIVGFPNETKDLFEESYNFCRKMNFAKIHVFPYSKRDGTTAATMDNQIDEVTKKERVRELLKLSNKLEEQYNTRFIDKELIVLTEEYKNGFTYGHTSNYIRVGISSKLDLNTEYRVQIKQICKNNAIGDLKINNYQV